MSVGDLYVDILTAWWPCPRSVCLYSNLLRKNLLCISKRYTFQIHIYDTYRCRTHAYVHVSYVYTWHVRLIHLHMLSAHVTYAHVYLFGMLAKSCTYAWIWMTDEHIAFALVTYMSSARLHMTCVRMHHVYTRASAQLSVSQSLCNVKYNRNS